MTEYATLDAVKTRLEITDENDDDQLAVLIGQVNDWLDGALECEVGPSAATQLILDGSSARNDGRMLFIRHGVRTLTDVATGIDETFAALSADSWLLRPLAHNRMPGWPAQEVWRIDGRWPAGYDNIRLTGTFGFAVVPPALREIAETVAVRAFLGQSAGQRDMTGNDQQGQPLVSRYVALRDRDTIRRFRSRLGVSRGFASLQLTSGN
jgi:hypothetical protein